MPFVLAAACAGTLAGPAPAAPSQRLIGGWPDVTLGVSGANVVLGSSSAPVIRPGGFTVFRTDTFRLALNGNRLSGRVTEDIIFRTSAGKTRVGSIAGDTTGRYVVVVNGANFPPQVLFCCTSEPRDLPLEADGRVNGPRAIAATLDGPVARYVLRNPNGSHTLVSYTVSDRPGQPFTLRLAGPLGGDTPAAVAMAPGIVATVDAATRRTILLRTTALGAYELFGGQTLPPQPGVVSRLHITRTMAVALVRTATGFELVRHDAPEWRRTVIWRGTRAPELSAVGDRTVAFSTGATVRQSVPGRTRVLLRLKSRAAALATDGRRVAIAERRTVRVRGKATRKTAILVTSVLQPPGAHSIGGGS